MIWFYISIAVFAFVLICVLRDAYLNTCEYIIIIGEYYEDDYTHTDERYVERFNYKQFDTTASIRLAERFNRERKDLFMKKYKSLDFANNSKYFMERNKVRCKRV